MPSAMAAFIRLLYRSLPSLTRPKRISPHPGGVCFQPARTCGQQISTASMAGTPKSAKRVRIGFTGEVGKVEETYPAQAGCAGDFPGSRSQIAGIALQRTERGRE